MHTLRQRWHATWDRLALPPPVHGFDDLAARYGEPHRHYHTLRHLEECFAALDLLRGQVLHVSEVELAVWFHDAIYDVHRDDNEAVSADLAARVMANAGAGMEAIDRVRALILTTRHHAPAGDPDALVLSDADLAILAAEPPRFLEYDRQIRKEYGHVPDAAFVRGRRGVLEGFLRKPAIFSTPAFAQRHEHRARANLTDALRRLA